jgi:glyoxylase-like metal-dependent hydrolase (beta-lactamase superfamily II)
MFGVVPKVLWSKSHPSDDLNRIEMVSRCLLIVGEGKVVLVNSGIGKYWGEKERSIYGIIDSVDLSRSLGELGYEPQDVTHVIQTHMHFDHIGGGTEIRGQVRLPSFPNALYYTQKRHYQWACNPSEKDRASFIADHWECIVGNGRMRWVQGKKEILPGIFLHIVHGHTPYQQLPRITDGSSTLLFCSDLIPLASQVRIPWIMGYDLRPVVTVREKKEVLVKAAVHDWFLFLEHDPQYELCKVAFKEEGFAVSAPLSL